MSNRAYYSQFNRRRNTGSGYVSVIAFFVGLAILLILGGFALWAKIRWSQDVSGYLEQAANANTVEMAKPVLKRAIAGIEERGAISGNTSLFFQTPGNDVGYWYRNIKAAEAELETLPENSTAMEKSNVLLKLRETLMEHGKEGDKVTQPGGISRAPYNMAYFIFCMVGLILTAPVMVTLKD